MSIFWEKALSIMEDKGLRQVDLMRVTGQSRSGVSAWVTRDLVPKADDALKIADLLGVSVRYLVAGQDDAVLPYRVRKLVDIMLSLPEEDLISIGEFIDIMKKNEWRKKGNIPLPPDSDV